MTKKVPISKISKVEPRKSESKKSGSPSSLDLENDDKAPDHLANEEDDEKQSSSSGQSTISQCAYTQLCQLFQNSKEEFNYEEAIRKFENTEAALREKAVGH